MTNQKIILVATAIPDDSGQVRTDRFVSAIQKGLRDAESSDKYRLEVVLATDLKNFAQALEDYKPHILVLVGHGNELDRFVFEAKDGGREFAKPIPFANTLGLYAQTLECVLVIACHSQSLAQKITEHISYAVGYEDVLLVDVAKNYTENFIYYLAKGNDYENTNRKAKIFMLNNFSENQIPVLFVKTQKEIVFEDEDLKNVSQLIEKQSISSLLASGKSKINQSSSFGKGLHSFKSTFEIYLPIDKLTELTKIHNIEELLLEKVLILYPHRDNEPEIDKVKIIPLNQYKEDVKTDNSFFPFQSPLTATLTTPKNMNVEEIIEFIEAGKLDEAFKQFITLTRSTEIYTNFLMPLNLEYQEYKDDKLVGKDVRGKLADITQRLMKILDRYENTIIDPYLKKEQTNDTTMDKKEWKKLFAKNPEQFFTKMENVLDNKSYNKLIKYQTSFERLKEKIVGIDITQENYDVEFGKIQEAINVFIDKL